MSVGHCGLICFANLSRGRIVLGSLARLATESGPGNKEIGENCIRYVDFVPKSHVPFRPPSHPLRSPNSHKASGGLSLSLFLSNDSARRGASASGVGSHGPAGTEDLIGTRSVGEEGSVCHS